MHRFQYSIRNLLGIVAIVALVVLAGRAFVRSFSIPQEAITLTAIGETHFRIHIFATQNNRLPTTLSELAPRPGYANRVEDARGQRLIYDVDEEGVISPGSFGRDGQRGGDGEDSDIIRRFRSFDESGAFIAETTFGLSSAKFWNGTMQDRRYNTIVSGFKILLRLNSESKCNLMAGTGRVPNR